MKTKLRSVIGVTAFVVLGLIAGWELSGRIVLAQQAQPATAVQQTTTHQDACIPQVASGASPQTLTIAAPGTPGQSVYIDELDMGAWTTAAPTAGAGTITAAGFTNNPVWTFEFAATANINWNPSQMNFSPGGMKALPNTAVTFTGSTFTSVSEFIHACFYYGY